jgi:predicted Rdx family selenoprotein
MANEFFRAFGGDAAISLTPGANSRLEVRLDDELIFDKKAEDGKFPDLARVLSSPAAISIFEGGRLPHDKSPAPNPLHARHFT